MANLGSVDDDNNNNEREKEEEFVTLNYREFFIIIVNNIIILIIFCVPKGRQFRDERKEKRKLYIFKHALCVCTMRMS